MTESDTTVAAVIVTGASAAAVSETGAVVTAITVEIVTETERDMTETARWTAVAVMDHTSPAEVSAATTSPNEPHVGVHRRTSNHLSPLMLSSPTPPAFWDLRQTQANH